MNTTFAKLFLAIFLIIVSASWVNAAPVPDSSNGVSIDVLSEVPVEKPLTQAVPAMDQEENDFSNLIVARAEKKKKDDEDEEEEEEEDEDEEEKDKKSKKGKKADKDNKDKKKHDKTKEKSGK